MCWNSFIRPSVTPLLTNICFLQWTSSFASKQKTKQWTTVDHKPYQTHTRAISSWRPKVLSIPWYCMTETQLPGNEDQSQLGPSRTVLACHPMNSYFFHLIYGFTSLFIFLFSFFMFFPTLQMCTSNKNLAMSKSPSYYASSLQLLRNRPEM